MISPGKEVCNIPFKLPGKLVTQVGIWQERDALTNKSLGIFGNQM